jgi:steroid 5-alpha reductase family enzyme
MIFFQVACLLFLFFTTLFVVGQLLKNNSIVDIGWGTGFILVSLFTIYQQKSFGIKNWILVFLVVLGGLRLAYHVAKRNIGKPEDRRYTEMRAKWGNKFPQLKAFINVYMTQFVMMFIISLGITLINRNAITKISLLDCIGIAVWVMGYYFEVVGDSQLAKHLKNPENKGKLMTTGLWKYTRHPNYFGEAT